jgi:hypothetical protein
MAKFRLNSATVFTIATNAVPCPTAFNVDRNMDVYISECATGTVKEHVLGDIVVSGSFSGEIAADGVTALTYIAPKVSGALVLQPMGATGGTVQILSSDFKITSRSLAATTTGLTTYTCNFVMNQITISAI